jgi:DNA repair exonuclease SbcCD ATPase subunit
MRIAICLLAMGLLFGGCVASSKYETKTKEADALRDALAVTNKERNTLEGRLEALQKHLNDEKEARAKLSAQLNALEEENRRAGSELAQARKNYEGTRITREQFITELLEKEKATGKRIQELGGKVQACETQLEKLRKDAAAREAELAELQKSAPKPGDEESLRRERDILLGRVERLSEERRQEEKRRESRFAALGDAVGKISESVTVGVLGPTLRVYIPERILLQKKGGLSGGGRKVVSEVGSAAADFPSSSVLLTAANAKLAGEIKETLKKGAKLPEERILSRIHEKEKGAELLLVVP